VFTHQSTTIMYDPLTDPLELPVQILTADCRAGAPLIFPRHAGATPGTTLNGAFGNVIWEVACLRQRRGLPACNHQGDHCQQPEHCPVTWLYKPYSQVHRRTLTRPVLLQAPALETGEPVAAFELRVTLWGRQAVHWRATVEAALRAMGRRGLGPDGARVPFVVAGIDADPPRTLAERAATLTAAHRWREALLVFETPFLHRETVAMESGQREKLFLAGGALPLAALLGNRAYDLAAWDMEDRELGELDATARHDLARQARRAAEALAESLRVTACDLRPVSLGARLSKTDGNPFPLRGFIGQARITGDLNPVLPWLLALALGGGGQKRAMGFGVVRLWLGP
jgi:hypothetical protein